MEKEHYLGDGLYARIDGPFDIMLRAPRENGDHYVVLDYEMLQELVKLCRLKKIRIV